jgi:hypothetical protein
MARALRNDIFAIENAGAKMKFQMRYRALAGISTAIAMMITEMVTAVSSCMRPLVFLFIVFLLKKLIKRGQMSPR